MHTQLLAASVAIAMLSATLLTSGCANTTMNEPSSGPITIERQGSFFVGGRTVQAAGTFDPTASPNPPTAGQSYWVDQMYVQYQIPVNARKLPLVLVHGGSGTGRVWETTPDGREGYQTIFLRRGYPSRLAQWRQPPCGMGLQDRSRLIPRTRRLAHRGPIPRNPARLRLPCAGRQGKTSLAAFTGPLAGRTHRPHVPPSGDCARRRTCCWA